MLPTSGQILRFDVADIACALPLGSVREVQRAVALTRLPGAPPVVEGVVDLRGEIVPVLDLRDRLGAMPAALRADHFLIFVWTGKRLLGVRADRVHGIESLAASDFAAAATVTRGNVEVAGLARVPSGLLLLHDAAALLRQAESEVLDRALAERSASA